MSKGIKAIASVALPIIGTIVAPGIGTALGSSLSSAALAGIGGAVGGAAGGVASGGGLKGAATGAVLGGVGGYGSAGGFSNMVPGSVANTYGVGGKLGATVNALHNSATVSPNALTSLTRGLSEIGSGISSSSSLFNGGGNSGLTAGNIGTALYSASAGQTAAEEAAKKQIDAANQAITQVRGDLQPYREAGINALNGLTSLVNDPNAQVSFIQNNPFYNSLADDAKNKLFANQAAKGKVGTGGTAAALQNSLLLLGTDLLNTNIGQKQNLANTGFNAANQSATATGNLITQRGNADAAGTIGGYNATTGAINNAIGTQAGLYAIDKGIRL